MGATIAISGDELAALRHAAQSARALLAHAEHGWSHPAVDPSALEQAALQLGHAITASGTKARVAIVGAIDCVLPAIAATNPHGLLDTREKLAAVAARARAAGGGPVPRELGSQRYGRSRLSPLAE